MFLFMLSLHRSLGYSQYQYVLPLFLLPLPLCLSVSVCLAACLSVYTVINVGVKPEMCSKPSGIFVAHIYESCFQYQCCRLANKKIAQGYLSLFRPCSSKARPEKQLISSDKTRQNPVGTRMKLTPRIHHSTILVYSAQYLTTSAVATMVVDIPLNRPQH